MSGAGRGVAGEKQAWLRQLIETSSGLARHPKGVVQKDNAGLLVHHLSVELSTTIVEFIAARSTT
jgi:hypothetical protein